MKQALEEPEDGHSSSSESEAEERGDESHRRDGGHRVQRGQRRNGQRARQRADRLHAGSVVATTATYERLHKQHHALWREACRGPFRAYQRAHEEDDDEKRVQAIRNILLLPQQVLARRRGGVARGRSQLINQLRRAASAPQVPRAQQDAQAGNPAVREQEEPLGLDGDESDGELERAAGRVGVEDNENVALQQRQNREAKAASPQEIHQLRSIGRAAELVSFGHIGKAARALVSEEPVEVTEEVKEQLAAMHSATLTPGTSLPELPEEGIPVLVVIEGRLRHTIREYASSGPSKGPSGWTGELLSAIAEDAEITRSLCRLCEDIGGGRLPTEAHTMLTACREVPIRKKIGSTRVRPINPAEPFLQIAAKYILDQEIGKPVFREMFEGTQYAVGVPGGCEVAAHVTRVALEVGGPETVCVAPDFQNAFGSVKRQVVMEELLKQPDLRPIWSMAHWMLRRPCLLLLQDRHHRVTRIFRHGEGLCQGSTTSPAFFSVATLAVYKEVQEAYPNVTITPFLDDPPMTGTVSEVTAALALLETKAAAVGLRLNIGKTQILYSSADLPEALRPLTARGATWDKHGIRVLGTNIGPHTDWSPTLTQLQEQEVAAQQRLLSAVEHKNLPAPAALHIVRACGVPRLNYASRTAPPEQLASLLQICDESLASAVCSRFSIPRSAAGAPETAAFAQMQLPIRLGGLGIRLASKTAPGAFVAAAAACAPYTASLIERVPADQRAALPYLTSLTQALQNVKTAGQLADEDIQQTGAELIEAFRESSARKLQNLITKRVELAAAKRLEQSLQVIERARFVSLRLKESGRFVTMVASTDRNLISDEYFCAAVQLRLGVRHGPGAPTCPGCGSASYHDNITHPVGCKKLKRTVLLKRHDGIVHALVRICQQNDIPVFVEPRLAADRRKPDLDITLGQQRFLVDVVVVNPADASHAERSARNAKTELKYRENAKVNKYSDIAAEHKAVVVPFACSAFGGLGDAALGFVQRLRDHLRLSEAERQAVQAPESADEMVGALLRDIAVALARSNGRACVELATRLASQRGAGRRRRQRAEGDGDQPPSSEDSDDNDDDSDAAGDSKTQGRSAAPVEPAAAAGQRSAPPAAGASERSAASASRSGQSSRPETQVSMRSESPLLHVRTRGARKHDRAAAAHGRAAQAHGDDAAAAQDMGARVDPGGVRSMDAAVLPASPLSRLGTAPYVAMRNASDNARQRRDASAFRRRAILLDLHPPCDLGHPRREAVQEQARLARDQRLTRARLKIA